MRSAAASDTPHCVQRRRAVPAAIPYMAGAPTLHTIQVPSHAGPSDALGIRQLGDQRFRAVTTAGRPAEMPACRAANLLEQTRMSRLVAGGRSGMVAA